MRLSLPLLRRQRCRLQGPLFSHARVPSRNALKVHSNRTFSSSADIDNLVLMEHDAATRITTLKLNLPDKLNALSIEMGQRFEDVVNSLRTNAQDTGCVILTGSGKAFSAGGDLQFLKDRHNDTPSRNHEIMRDFYRRMLSIRTLPVPVVAAINGPAIGAGLAVALACDLRLCTDKAKMGITFVQLGLHPGMGSTFFLQSILGPQLAARLMLTGEMISGKTAVEMGLVLESHETQEELMEAANALAGKIAKASPIAIRGTIKSLRMMQSASFGGLEYALSREADAQGQTYYSKDLFEGVSAVAEKRAPEFTDYEDYNA